jgi:hypothetical protein
MNPECCQLSFGLDYLTQAKQYPPGVPSAYNYHRREKSACTVECDPGYESQARRWTGSICSIEQGPRIPGAPDFMLRSNG